MAPHADDTFVDTSGYTPATNEIAELKRALRLHHASSIRGVAWVNDCPRLSDGSVTDLAKNTLQLSLADLKEIEDAYSHFQGKTARLM